MEDTILTPIYKDTVYQLFIFEKIEVIGNIYDNPELLEVKDE